MAVELMLGGFLVVGLMVGFAFGVAWERSRTDGVKGTLAADSYREFQARRININPRPTYARPPAPPNPPPAPSRCNSRCTCGVAVLDAQTKAPSHADGKEPAQ